MLLPITLFVIIGGFFLWMGSGLPGVEALNRSRFAEPKNARTVPVEYSLAQY